MSTLAIKTEQATKEQIVNDLAILNRSLEGEYFGVAAYQAAIGSGLLAEGVVEVAMQFQSHHEHHADCLIEAIRRLGGTLATRQTWEEMAAAFPPPPLASQEDVLRYAASLESSAASGDICSLSELESPELRQLVSRIAGVEAMHWAVLLGALGENPVPHALMPLPS